MLNLWFFFKMLKMTQIDKIFCILRFLLKSHGLCQMLENKWIPFASGSIFRQLERNTFPSTENTSFKTFKLPLCQIFNSFRNLPKFSRNSNSNKNRLGKAFELKFSGVASFLDTNQWSKNEEILSTSMTDLCWTWLEWPF